MLRCILAKIIDKIKRWFYKRITLILTPILTWLVARVLISIIVGRSPRRYEWFRNWWLLILSLVLLAIGLGLVLGFNLAGLESVRWTLSALVQAGAAIMGIFFVALGLLWNQANQENERLRDLIPNYMNIISPSVTHHTKDFIDIIGISAGLIGIAGDSAERFKKENKKTFAECIFSLITLSKAALTYFNKQATEKLENDGLVYDINFSDEEKRRMNNQANRLSDNAVEFFDYLYHLETQINVLKHYARQEVDNSAFYSEILHKARKRDRAYESLWQLRFVNYFRRKGIIIISAMWLTCISIGLMILFAVDKIAGNLLPYLASVPLAIGVAAIGVTLSLGFRAMYTGR